MKKRLLCKMGLIATTISIAISISSIPTSAKANGWIKFGNNWSYLDNGKWKTGWFNENPNGVWHQNRWYYFDQNGVMQKGWIYWNGNWYYLGCDGAMCQGWIKDDGKWYYLNEKGDMRRNELINSGIKLYYLSDDGSMVTDTTIKGFHFGSDGCNDRRDVKMSYTQLIDYAKTLGFTFVEEGKELGSEITYKLKKNLPNECGKDEIKINKFKDKIVTISTNGLCHSENYDELNKIIKGCVPSIADEIISYIRDLSHNLSLKPKSFWNDGREVYVYTKDADGIYPEEKGQLFIEIK